MWNPETNIRGPQGPQGVPGEVEEAPLTGGPWVRQGGEWVEVVIEEGGAAVLLSDTPPVGAEPGNLWVETDTGLMYVWFDDGTSQQWFAVSGATSGGPAGPVGPQGIQGIQGIQGEVGPVQPIYVSDTPPPSPIDNMLWFESDTGTLLLRYSDLDSKQWISVFGGFTDMVRYSVAQGLTAPQQAQARANIGAAAPVAAVIYDAAQTLTTPQQTQARANIAAAVATPFDTAWIPFPYVNGWVDYGAPYGPCGYRKNPNGIVMLKGLVASGTATTIFTLPAGYRPVNTLLLNVQTSPNVACRLDLSAAGVLTHTGGNNGWISLGGIMFLAEN